MDHGDFDFPPDSATGDLGFNAETINNVPLRVLSNTPVDQLPPTILPPEQRRPIQELLQSSRQMRRAVLLRAQAGDAAKDERSMPLPKTFLSGHKRARFTWSEEELREFYKFLSQYGTDFNAIAVMYPGRTRDDVKRLYHRELRKRGDDVRAALSLREEIDLGIFKARLKKREELQRGPVRQLDQEEEEALRLIEAGTLEPQTTPKEEEDGGTPAGTIVDNDFEFDMVEAKGIKAKDIQPVNSAELSDIDGEGSAIMEPVHAQLSSVTKSNNVASVDDALLTDFTEVKEPFEEFFWED